MLAKADDSFYSGVPNFVVVAAVGSLYIFLVLYPFLYRSGLRLGPLRRCG